MQHQGRPTIELLSARARRLYRQVRSRLRRSSTLLLLVAVLSLGEPLLCIVHCDVWLPLLQTLRLQHTTASVHDHYQHHDARPAQGHAHAARPEAGARDAQPSVCALHLGGPGPAPLTPPSPIHDLLLTALAPLGAVLLYVFHCPCAPQRPRPRAEPPPSPPPIPAL